MKTLISLLIPIPMLMTCEGAFGASPAAATGSASPTGASSFQAPFRKTYEGRCIAMLRPTGGAGKIQLTAEADGLKPATIAIRTP